MSHIAKKCNEVTWHIYHICGALLIVSSVKLDDMKNLIRSGVMKRDIGLQNVLWHVFVCSTYLSLVPLFVTIVLNIYDGLHGCTQTTLNLRYALMAMPAMTLIGYSIHSVLLVCYEVSQYDATAPGELDEAYFFVVFPPSLTLAQILWPAVFLVSVVCVCGVAVFCSWRQWRQK